MRKDNREFLVFADARKREFELGKSHDTAITTKAIDGMLERIDAHTGSAGEKHAEISTAVITGQRIRKLVEMKA